MDAIHCAYVLQRSTPRLRFMARKQANKLCKQPRRVAVRATRLNKSCQETDKTRISDWHCDLILQYHSTIEVDVRGAA